MTTPSDAYDGERLARAVKSLLEANLAAKLDVVQARWAVEAAVSLPDPVTFHLGFNPNLLELESTSFPFVAVIPGERVPEESARRAWGVQSETYVVDIHFFVVADTEAEVGPVCWRYAEAVTLVLQDSRAIGGYEQVAYKPDVEVGLSGRHPKKRFANMTKAADVDYVQGARVTIELMGG